MDEKKINRRKFLTDSSLKLAGAGLLLNQFAARAVFGGDKPAANQKLLPAPAMEYRVLGKTGLKVSAVSFGVMRLTEPAVLFKALDLGINYFDTAESYQNGNNEKMLGTVLKQHGRKKVFIATKIHPFDFSAQELEKSRPRDRKTLNALFDKCLERLQTDYVDVFFIHNIMVAGQQTNEEVLAFVEKIKKDGKARFVGISIHDPRCYVDVVNQVATAKVYDVILAWFNFKSPPEYIEALKRAAKANVGIIAMKTQAGGYPDAATAGISPQQAALRWALQQPYVSCAIPGMVNIEQVVENVGAVEKKVGWRDRKSLHCYYAAIKDKYCIMCGQCAETCSNKIDVYAINRALMYCEGYKDFEQGRQTYRELASSRNARACLSCSSPTFTCANGMQICERMRYAHSLFA